MRKFLLSALFVASVSIMSAGVIFNAEAVGQTTTTVANTTTVNFNGLPLGAFSGSTAIGTYTAGGSIVAADQFSGDASNYISIGAQSNGTTTYTLNFNSPQTFFGMLWNAMDSENSLTFTTNGAPVTFNSTSFASLANAYKGNPSPDPNFHGKDSSEFFVYLDFFGTSGTTFTSVTFSNKDGNTGFETDNHSILASTVPEPSTYGMLFAGLAALGVVARRRRARKL